MAHYCDILNPAIIFTYLNLVAKRSHVFHRKDRIDFQLKIEIVFALLFGDRDSVIGLERAAVIRLEPGGTISRIEDLKEMEEKSINWSNANGLEKKKWIKINVEDKSMTMLRV